MSRAWRWGRVGWPVCLCATLVVLAACGDPTASGEQVLTLETNRGEYAMGERVELTLTNHGPLAIGPGNSPETLLCQPEVQRRRGSNWESVGKVSEACILPGLPPLEPGGSVERALVLSAPFFAPGTAYRFGVIVSTGGRLLACYSNEFMVGA